MRAEDTPPTRTARWSWEDAATAMESVPDDSRDEAERRRLASDGALGNPAGVGTDVLTVRTRVGAPRDVIERSREVLLIVTSRTSDRWPTLDEWRRLLPAWFVG